MYTKFIAGLGIAGMLLASAPIAMAHERGDDDVRANVSTQVKTDNGLHLGWFLGKHNGGDDRDSKRDDKRIERHGTSTGTSTKPRHDNNQRARVNGNVVGGVVTSVSGNTFVIGGKGTTTVTLASDAKVVSRDGSTTTAAITTGTKVIAFGTTTATSTNGNTFTASVVIVFNKAMGHLKHWLRF